MLAVATALAYVLFVWWFSTGLVLLLVLRGRRALVLAGAAALFPLSLVVLARSGSAVGVGGAYVAFTAALLLWATQEVAFLTGALTGPHPRPCPHGAVGAARLRAALGALLYHEIGLIVSGLAVVAVTWGARNEVGVLTFLVLWIMRLSAKLNLYLGVPVLNDAMLPPRLGFLRSYFRRGPVNPLFPLTLLLSVLILAGLVAAAADPQAAAGATMRHVLVAGLMALAIVEHLFMLVPLPIDRLWAWSATRHPVAPTQMPDEIERAVVPSV